MRLSSGSAHTKGMASVSTVAAAAIAASAIASVLTLNESISASSIHRAFKSRN